MKLQCVGVLCGGEPMLLVPISFSLMQMQCVGVWCGGDPKLLHTHWFSLIQMQCLGSYGVVMPCCFVSIALMSVTKAMQLWWCLFACGPVITQLRGRHPPFQTLSRTIRDAYFRTTTESLLERLCLPIGIKPGNTRKVKTSD